MRLLLADDAAVLRAVVAHIVGGQHEIVGEADDGARAVALATELQPDAVLVDGRLPPGVVPLLADLRAAAPDAAIYVIAALGEVALVRAAVAAGAHGALRRPLLASEVRAALADLARTHAR